VAIYAAPGQAGSKAEFLPRYDHWINGQFVAPSSGQYFENISPVTGQVFTEVARGNVADVETALDAAHAAFKTWGKTSVTERSNILLKIADRMEANLEALAVAETWENGKPVRETLAADLPLAIDHFRYFAGAIRAQEGSIGELNDDTVAYHFHEPLGVVAQIIPWNFPILMAVWKIAPALAAGNCIILKPAEQTPVSIHFWMNLIKDLLPPGVLNILLTDLGSKQESHLHLRVVSQKLPLPARRQQDALSCNMRRTTSFLSLLNSVVRVQIFSSATSRRLMTLSTIKLSKDLRCLPLTKAKFVHVHRVH
jgi:aldehyde dehydrogenase